MQLSDFYYFSSEVFQLKCVFCFKNIRDLSGLMMLTEIMSRHCFKKRKNKSFLNVWPEKLTEFMLTTWTHLVDTNTSMTSHKIWPLGRHVCLFWLMQ